MRRELLLLLLLAASAWAESPPPKDDSPDIPAGFSLQQRSPLSAPPKSIDHVVSAPGDAVSAADALDEILDDFAADVARVGARSVSPMLIDRIELSSNVSPQYARIIEARLAASLFRAATVSIVHCLECWAVHADVQNGQWVVRRGLTGVEDLRKLGENYKAKSLLRVDFVVQQFPATISLDVQLLRPDDGSIAFAESYRVHPDNALVYRGADQAQTREARLKELEARLDAHPAFGVEVRIGSRMLDRSADQGALWGGVGGVRLYETFGEDHGNRFGITAQGFLNTSVLSAAVLSAGYFRRFTDGNVFRPECFAGPAVGAIISGSPGNTAMFSLDVECRLVTRLGLYANLAYVPKFTFTTGNYDIGGFSPEMGVNFTW